jgi:hypothetical protein
MTDRKIQSTNESLLLNEIALLIEKSKVHVIAQAKSTLTLLFWKVGMRINEFVLQNKRAGYGKQIVVTLSRQLEKTYGRNFAEKNLRRMLQFADLFQTRISRYMVTTIMLVTFHKTINVQRGH